MLQIFSGLDYFCSKNGDNLNMEFTGKICLLLNISCYFDSIPLGLFLVGWDGGLSTLFCVIGAGLIINEAC